MRKISLVVCSVMLASFLSLNAFADLNKNINIDAEIDETISLTLSSNKMNFDLSNMELVTDDLVVTGSTNNLAGYSISFNVNSEYNNLKHSNSLIDAEIPSITEDSNIENFSESAWGFSVDGENFSQIPLAPLSIFSTTGSGTKNHTFTVGVRGGDDLAAGDYENELLFTIVANPEQRRTFEIVFDALEVPKNSH